MPRKKTKAPPRPKSSPADPLPSVFDRVLSNLDHSTLQDSFNSELTQALEALPPTDATRLEADFGFVRRWMQSALSAIKIDDPSARLMLLRTSLDSVHLLDHVPALELFKFVDNAARVFDEFIRSTKTNDKISEASIESLRGMLQVLLMSWKKIWAKFQPESNRRKPNMKKINSLVDRIEQIHSYWRETMSADQKQRLVTAKIEDLKLYLGSFQNDMALKLFSEAVDFFSENKTWNKWICCLCGKEFMEEELIGEHYWQIHLESLSPDLLSVLPEDVDKEWAEMIGNVESWKPVDTAKALETKQTTSKFQNWPISDDPDRIAFVTGIHGLLRSFHKKKYLSQYLLELMIEYTMNKLERVIPKAKLRNHGLHKTPRCILFLEVPEMVEMFSILTKIALSCHLTESSENESFLEDMITHQEFGFNEWVRSSSDFSSIILNIVADDESWPEIDTFIYWLFSAPKLQISLSRTSYIREKRKDFGMKIFVKFEEALKTLAKECTALCECLSFYEEAVVVSNTCLEELEGRGWQTHESFFGRVLERVAQKGVEKALAFEYLHFILNLEEDSDVDDDDESRSAVSNNSSNKGESTEDGVRKAIIRLIRKRTIEIAIHAAKLMRFKATMDHWEMELKQTAVYDYRSILATLMMSLTQAKMVNLVDRDAEVKANAAGLSLLADLAIEEETCNNKKGDNIKKMQKNSKQRKRNKYHTKAKNKEPCNDKKIMPNHDQAERDHSSVNDSQKLEICSPVGADELKQLDEDLKHNTDVEEMANMLEERLELQRQFEKEAKKSRLCEKNKRINETTANGTSWALDPVQEEEDYLSKEKLKVALEEDTKIVPTFNGISHKDDSDMCGTWMETHFEKTNAAKKEEKSIENGAADKTIMYRRPKNFKEPCSDVKFMPNHDQAEQDHSSVNDSHKLEIFSTVGADELKQLDEDLQHNTDVEKMAKMLEERLEFHRQLEKEAKECCLYEKNKKTNETIANGTSGTLDPVQDEEDNLSKKNVKVSLEEDTKIVRTPNGINNKNDSDMCGSWTKTDLDAAEKANAVKKAEKSIKKGGADKTTMYTRPKNFKEPCSDEKFMPNHDQAEQDHSSVNDSYKLEIFSPVRADELKQLDGDLKHNTDAEKMAKMLEERFEFQRLFEEAKDSCHYEKNKKTNETTANVLSYKQGCTMVKTESPLRRLVEDPVQEEKDCLSKEKLKVGLEEDTEIVPTTNGINNKNDSDMCEAWMKTDFEKANAAKKDEKSISKGGADKTKIYRRPQNFKDPCDYDRLPLCRDSAEQDYCLATNVGDSHDFEHDSSLGADVMKQLDEDLKHKTDIEEPEKELEEKQDIQMQSDNQADNETTSAAEGISTKSNGISFGSLGITIGAFEEDKNKLWEVFLKKLLRIPLVEEETKISPTNYHVNEYNCFLNAIIKSLWRVRSFREKFLSRSRELHSHFPDPCIVCVLYDMFTSLSTGSREITTPASLEIALSNLYPDGNFYQEGEMNEPSELVGVLLFRLHLASINFYHSQKKPEEEGFRESWNCDGDLCFSHPFFRMKFLEKRVCQNCDLESMKSIYSSFIDYVNASTLREIKNSNGDSTFSQLLELDQTNQPYPCDPDAGGCSSRGLLTRSLVNHPHVYAIDLGWQSVSESAEDISATLAIVTVEIDVSNTGIKYRLISMVCFHELHYFCLARSHEHENWTLNDDRHVKMVGCWDDVRILCGKCRFQPQLLFFEAVE